MGFKADIIPDRRQLREVRSKSSARADEPGHPSLHRLTSLRMGRVWWTGGDARHSITHFAQDDKKSLRDGNGRDNTGEGARATENACASIIFECLPENYRLCPWAGWASSG